MYIKQENPKVWSLGSPEYSLHPCVIELQHIRKCFAFQTTWFILPDAYGNIGI